MIKKHEMDYWTGTVYTTNRRVWEHDEDFKDYLRQIRAIPHNAILQQIGYPVNVIAGAGTAAGERIVNSGTVRKTLPPSYTAEERARLAEGLRQGGQEAAVITLPDSLCWLLNLRGADVPRNPILHGFALLGADGAVDLFVDAAKLGDAARAHLGDGVRLQDPAGFGAALAGLRGAIRVDKTTAPLAVSQAITAGGGTVVWGDDPCRLPKACKNAAEVEGMRAAHLRDGAAVVEFLCWLDQAAPKGGLTEIDVVTALEGYRRATNALHDISFDTICGAGPNGAIMHYRVTAESNRAVGQDELLLVDSGAQFKDGTTDITRTVAVGDPGAEARACYTRVLQGMIAISRVRWPRGIAGRDLDALANHLPSFSLPLIPKKSLLTEPWEKKKHEL